MDHRDQRYRFAARLEQHLDLRFLLRREVDGPPFEHQPSRRVPHFHASRVEHPRPGLRLEALEEAPADARFDADDAASLAADAVLDAACHHASTSSVKTSKRDARFNGRPGPKLLLRLRAMFSRALLIWARASPFRALLEGRELNAPERFDFVEPTREAR